MIFLSAQPSYPTAYFLWQTKVQHHNFEKIGIDLSTVYALVSYTDQIPVDWLNFKKESKATILFYEDTRVNRGYVSSIRPHIIAKFFTDFPSLKNQWCFYHDSDVTFRILPDFDALQKTSSWKLSDTISYIGYNYICEKGVDVLLDMCEIVGISPLMVRSNQLVSGGCQYLLRNISVDYWQKVERDSELLYTRISSKEVFYKERWMHNSQNYVKDYSTLQIWCADMWAVLWNAWLYGHSTEISDQLSFSWGTSSKREYDRHNLFHNAGVVDGDKHRLFYKSQFQQHDPFNTDLDFVEKDTASYEYVQLIKEVANINRPNTSESNS